MTISATSGVVSSIDYESLIGQMLSLKKTPINNLNTDISKLNNVSSLYGTLSSKVQDLKSAADDLKAINSFDVFTSDVSDETIIGASIGSTAAKGSYDLVVTSLAKSHKIAADGVAESTSTIASGSGSFNFTVGSGDEQTISIDATTTLEDLRSAINDLDAGVTANIINDGTSPNPYRLSLTSDETGTTNTITITQNDSDLAFSTTLQDAADAAFTVDGMSITKASNHVTDVIEGVTFDLKSADAATTVTLNVSRDYDGIVDKVKAFIDKYNGVVACIKANNRYDTETKKAGAFFGDSAARSVWDDLRRTMTSPVSGLPDTMNRLIHAGITTDSNGMMSVDESDLKEALNTSYDDVRNLFITGTSTDGFASLISDMADVLSNSADGRIKSRQDGIASNISSLELSVRNRESELNDYEVRLRAQYTALETTLASIKGQSNFLSGL